MLRARSRFRSICVVSLRPVAGGRRQRVFFCSVNWVVFEISRSWPAGFLGWLENSGNKKPRFLSESRVHKSLSTSVLGGTCPLSLRVAKASLDSIHDSRALCAPGITGRCRDHRPAGRTRSPGIELMEGDWRHRVSGYVLLTGSLSFKSLSGQLFIYYFDRKIYIKKS